MNNESRKEIFVEQTSSNDDLKRDRNNFYLFDYIGLVSLCNKSRLRLISISIFKSLLANSISKKTELRSTSFIQNCMNEKKTTAHMSLRIE